jgi:hypothetical protein
MLAENRALDACRAPCRPSWLLAARRATREEDEKGIDLVVESDVGQLQLQVKSSFHGKAKFLARRHDVRVAIVVVRPYDPEETVQSKVYSALGGMRACYRRASDSAHA